ncbi:TRAP transporter substrate-binding protein [Aurantimonas sp. 22II-16-19i]|uniref:TRAP transporter substrate-binding protein n=1 Tax=Aurantimonas sp. 22II-16-19i TaxID=1317114 RepID=UPI0009F7A5A6|nr:TRAP transporter substrate-binding protein [Aurantimonas sp. 22II-16-19i]ORE98112.1 TRAP dicarboxylate transporter subunit DctP [Aurantimonas sp. 22II-16-19i]
MKRLLVLAAALAATTCAASAQTTLRLSHWLPATHPVHITGIVPWAESIEAASGGELTIEIYPAQQLGAAPDHYDMTRDGIVDIGYVNPGYTAGRFPIYELTGVPFEANDGPKAAKAIHEFYKGDGYADKEMADVYFCLVNPHNPGRFHANAPIKVPADVKGKTVRPAHSTMARYINSLGGTSVQVPAPEARDAISKGTADAVTFPYEAMKSFKMADVVKFHNDLPLYLSSQVMLFNKASYDGLAADLRKVVDDHCTPEWSQKISVGWSDYDNEVRQSILDDASHEVYTPNADEVALWRESVGPVMDAWKADAEKAGYEPDKVLADYDKALEANDAKY